MTPFVVFYLLLSLAVFLIAWLKGGHIERAGVAICIVAYVAAYILGPVRVADLRVGEAASDVVVLLAFGWLAMRGNRWWPFAATAFMVLTLVVHGSMVFVPDLSPRGDVSARMGLGVMVILALLAGVAERWLAGERPASTDAMWNRRRRTP